MNFVSYSLRAAAALTLVLAVAGCDRAPAPQGEPQAPATPPAPAAVAAPTEFGENLLWIDPLKSCGDKQVAMVHWSKGAIAKGPASIEIGDVNPGVFARIGDEGQKETGPWAYPGAVLLVRGDDGEVRARQVVKGPADCSATPAPATEPTTTPATAPAPAPTTTPATTPAAPAATPAA